MVRTRRDRDRLNAEMKSSASISSLAIQAPESESLSTAHTLNPSIVEDRIARQRSRSYGLYDNEAFLERLSAIILSPNRGPERSPNVVGETGPSVVTSEPAAAVKGWDTKDDTPLIVTTKKRNTTRRMFRRFLRPAAATAILICNLGCDVRDLNKDVSKETAVKQACNLSMAAPRLRGFVDR